MPDQPDLIEVGYWHSERRPELPHPSSSASPAPPKLLARTQLLKALNSNSFRYLHSHELGYSTCRLCGLSDSTLGCCDLTDGTFVWPEGLVHYITHHNTPLPPEFLAHVTDKLAKKRTDERTGNLLMWDAARREGVPIPPSTEQYLREHSTLYNDPAHNRCIVL